MRATAVAALVAAAGCERLPAEQLHGNVIWQREFGTREPALARASDGGLFVAIEGVVSRLAPAGEELWSVEGSYSISPVYSGPGDLIAVWQVMEERPGDYELVALELLDGADGSPVATIDWPSTNGVNRVYGVAILSEVIAIVGTRRLRDPETGEFSRSSFVELYDRAGQRESMVEFDHIADGDMAIDPRGGFVLAGWEVDGDTDLGLGPLAAGQAAVNFLAWFDDAGALVSQHLAPDLDRTNSFFFFVGDDGAIYTGGAAHPGEPWAVLTRWDETGTREWELGVHGEETDHAVTWAAGVDGDVLYAAGQLEGTPGFGLLPDPAASGTERLPPDQQAFLVSVEAATGVVRWQRGLDRPVSPDADLVADTPRGLYLVEWPWRENEDGSGGGIVNTLVARED